MLVRREERVRKFCSQSNWSNTYFQQSSFVCQLSTWLYYRHDLVFWPCWFGDKKSLWFFVYEIHVEITRTKHKMQIKQWEHVKGLVIRYSQNNKILWLSNMADTFFLEVREVADWLGRQSLITWWNFASMENRSSAFMPNKDPGL